MTHPVSRRGFVAVGAAALATGALLTPRRAFGASQPPADLAVQLRAILDRPNASYFGASAPTCSCAWCTSVRTAGFTCRECGFEGAPVLSPCECRTSRASNLAYCRERIAALEGGEPVKPGDFSLAHYRRSLAENLARPDRVCTRLTERSIHCAHTSVNCPTCGNDGAHGVGVDADTLAATIRALRDVLRAHERRS